MSLALWAVFVPAAFALNLFPGPNNVLAMTHAARFGFATAVLAACGRFPPFAGFVLAASAELFTVVKLAGAAYLIRLGIAMLRFGTADVTARIGDGRLGPLLAREFWTAATNPKAMLVFTAFFAPFVDASRPAFGQILALGGVALLLELVAVAIYAAVGVSLGRLGRSFGALRLLERCSGAALVAAGLALLVARRPAGA